MQKIPRPKTGLRPGLLFVPHGMKKKRYGPEIESYEAKELDHKLQTFFAEERKNDGSDYEPDSLQMMIASLGPVSRKLRKLFGSANHFC